MDSTSFSSFSGDVQQTRSSTEPSEDNRTPCQRVFGTAELLEAILLDLSLFELFVIQRTCITFRNTIRGSGPLLEAMFLKPKSQDPHKGPCVKKLNPLLEQAVFATEVGKGRPIDGIYCRNTKLSSQGKLTFDIESEQYPGKLVPKQLKSGRRIAYRDRIGVEESWELMLASQPPPAHVRCRVMVPSLSQPTRPRLNPRLAGVHAFLSFSYYSIVRLERPVDLKGLDATHTWMEKGENTRLGTIHDHLMAKYEHYRNIKDSNKPGVNRDTYQGLGYEYFWPRVDTKLTQFCDDEFEQRLRKRRIQGHQKLLSSIKWLESGQKNPTRRLNKRNVREFGYPSLEDSEKVVGTPKHHGHDERKEKMLRLEMRSSGKLAKPFAKAVRL